MYGCVWLCRASMSMYVYVTGGHFACACVNPLNDNSVVASNLMAGNRKLARKVTVLLKAISLVLWIPYFPTKNVLHDKNRTFSTRVFTCRFFSSRFSWPFKDFEDPTPKSHVPVQVWFSLAKQCVSMVWFFKLGVLLIRKEMHRSNVQFEDRILCFGNFNNSQKMPLWHFNSPYWRMRIQNALLFVYAGLCRAMYGYVGLCRAV